MERKGTHTVFAKSRAWRSRFCGLSFTELGGKKLGDTSSAPRSSKIRGKTAQTMVVICRENALYAYCSLSHTLPIGSRKHLRKDLSHLASTYIIMLCLPCKPESPCTPPTYHCNQLFQSLDIRMVTIRQKLDSAQKSGKTASTELKRVESKLNRC